jgi:hypothetical protein
MIIEILSEVSYDGNILRLPDVKLERNDYLAIPEYGVSLKRKRLE